MADTKISALPAASDLTDAVIPIVQNGVNKKASSTLIVQSNTAGVTGADAINNIISLTQSEYDAIETPSASTLYIITDA